MAERTGARNIFLDGNTFRDSPSVARDMWVAEAQAGFVLKYDRCQLGFTAVYRTEEFETQLDPQRSGAVSLARRAPPSGGGLPRRRLSAPRTRSRARLRAARYGWFRPARRRLLRRA